MNKFRQVLNSDPQSTFWVRSLKPNTSYIFAVKFKNEAGESDWTISPAYKTSKAKSMIFSAFKNWFDGGGDCDTQQFRTWIPEIPDKEPDKLLLNLLDNLARAWWHGFGDQEVLSDLQSDPAVRR